MSLETLLNTGFKLLDQHTDLSDINKAFSFITYPSGQVDVFFTDEHNTRRIALITPARLTDGTVWFEGEPHWYQISTTPNGYYTARLPFERVLKALITYYRAQGEWNHLPINPHIDVHEPPEPEKSILNLKGVTGCHQTTVNQNIVTISIVQPTKETIQLLDALSPFTSFDEVVVTQTYAKPELNNVRFQPGVTFLRYIYTDSDQTIVLIFLNNFK